MPPWHRAVSRPVTNWTWWVRNRAGFGPPAASACSSTRCPIRGYPSTPCCCRAGTGPGRHRSIWLRQRWTVPAAPYARRVVTVCTGAFLAGRAGLLTGRTVATHWSRTQLLQDEFPEATVDPNRLYVRDGTLWSSGGFRRHRPCTSCPGRRRPRRRPRPDRGPPPRSCPGGRPGGQSMAHAVPMWAPRGSTAPVARAQNLIEADPSADHRAAVLAATVGMSERHFARIFAAEIGEPPARYVEGVRVQVAAHPAWHHHRDQTVSSIATWRPGSAYRRRNHALTCSAPFLASLESHRDRVGGTHNDPRRTS